MDNPLYQQKLVYLVLYDDIYTFDRLRKELFIDDLPNLYKALRYLAVNGLIYGHPILYERNPRRVHYRKAASLSLEVLDRSPRALHWALTDVDSVVDGMSRDWYVSEIKNFAKLNVLDLRKADKLRGLFLD